MADEQEVRQKLEFDAQQALTELDALSTRFTAFGTQLAAVVSRLDYFNSNAGKTVAALKQMASSAASTVAAFQTLSNVPVSGVSTGVNVSSTGTSQSVTSLGQIESASAQAAQAITDFGNKASDALDKTKNKSQSMMVSWQTLVRVVTTQAIVRAISGIRDAFSDAYDSALKFSKQIGEIRAIDPGRSFSQIASDVRSMSDSFNQPLSSVAEAQYQLISDQFTTAADRANVLSAANKLAKVSAQELSDATMLLTGALNAYGETSEMAGLRAAQFDKTIELGRLRMGELGTAMGRVQTIAHEVGLSMEEIQASLITVTIGGVKASEAATQLRGVMTGLLKPSEAMKTALREIGVASGEEAIATFGFQGALQKLLATTDGSSSRIAQLFQNVRGLAGVLRIAGSGADKYTEAMQKLRDVDLSTLQKKFEEFTSTDAEKLTAELNKLKNFWTAEVGTMMVSRLNTIIQLLGGGGGIAGMIRSLIDNTVKWGAAIAAISLAANIFGKSWSDSWMEFGKGADGAITKLGSLRAALGLLAAVKVAQVLGNEIGQMAFDQIAKEQNAIQEATQKELDIRKQKTEAAIREGERENEELIRQVRQRVAESMKFYLQDAENMKAAMKVQEKVIGESFSRVMSVRQKMTRELFQVSEEASKKALEIIPREIQQLQTEIADRSFTDLTRMLNPARQLQEFKSKAEQLAQEAAKLQGTAKDANEEKSAADAWKRAEAYAQMAESAGKQVGSFSSIRQVQEMLNNLDNKRIAALREQQKTQLEIAKEAEQRAHQAEIHNEELETLRQTIEQKLKTTVKTDVGDVQWKGPQDLKKDLGDATVLIDEFTRKYKQFSKEDFAKNFMGDTRAFESMKRELERTLAGVDLKVIKAAPEAIGGLYDQLQASADKIRLEVPAIARLEKITGMNILSDGIEKIFMRAGEILNASMRRSIIQPQLEASMKTAQKEFDQANEKLSQESMKRAGGIEGSNFPRYKEINDAQDRLLRFKSELVRLSQQANLTKADVENVTKELASMTKDRTLDKAFPSMGEAAERARVSKDFETMADAIKKMSDVQTEMNQNATLDDSEKKKAEEIQQSIQGLQTQKNEAGASANQMERGKNAAANTVTAVDNGSKATAAGIPVVGSLAEAWWGVARAAQAAAQAAAAASMAGGGESSGEEQYAALGGRIRYFGNGGFASRGTDTRLAMLTAGEFVMNAHSTRKFYSQLVAMNAGMTPAYKSAGGPVTNVGDISINVNGGNTSSQTIQEIGIGLRRAIKQGTLKLN